MIPLRLQHMAIDLIGAMTSPAAQRFANELEAGGADDGTAIARAALRTVATDPKVRTGLEEFGELMRAIARGSSKPR